MDIHSKKRESSGEKKGFSLSSLGITAHHAAPAVLMTVAGLALSAIISDVPPQFNQVFASQEVVIEESVSFFEELSTQVSGLLNPFGGEAENGATEKDELVAEETLKTEAAVNDLSYTKLLASGIMTLEKDKPQDDSYDFSAHVSAMTEEEAEKKLKEIEK